MHSIAYAFPRVKIVTTAVDPEINESFHVLPGIGNGFRLWFTLKSCLINFNNNLITLCIGNFGDRYFGTEPCANGVDESDDCIDD